MADVFKLIADNCFDEFKKLTDDMEKLSDDDPHIFICLRLSILIMIYRRFFVDIMFGNFSLPDAIWIIDEARVKLHNVSEWEQIKELISNKEINVSMSVTMHGGKQGSLFNNIVTNASNVAKSIWGILQNPHMKNFLDEKLMTDKKRLDEIGDNIQTGGNEEFTNVIKEHCAAIAALVDNKQMFIDDENKFNTVFKPEFNNILYSNIGSNKEFDNTTKIKTDSKLYREFRINNMISILINKLNFEIMHGEDATVSLNSILNNKN